MSYNSGYPSFLAMSQLVAKPGPAPKPQPDGDKCPPNMVNIGGSCYPPYNYCQGGNTSPTGYCDATHHINFPQNVANMRMYIEQLTK